MTDLRVGDEVFTDRLVDGRTPKASIGAAFIDGRGQAWVLVPKLFAAESRGKVYASAGGGPTLVFDVADKVHFRAARGGFACLQVSATTRLFSYPRSPSDRTPSVLDHVSFGEVTGQVAGNMGGLTLPSGETEPEVILVNYFERGNAAPNVGSVCDIDDGPFGVTVGISRTKKIVAVVPLLRLRDRFETSGLRPARDSDLRDRNFSIDAGQPSELQIKATELAQWLEARVEAAGGLEVSADPMTRLVTAIAQLERVERIDAPLPSLPAAFGSIKPRGWAEVVGLAAIGELAMGKDGDLISLSQHSPHHIRVTDLIAAAVQDKRRAEAAE